MAGMQPTQNTDGTWTYPSSKDVLKAGGLKTINHYIRVCQETIARFIIDQPLFVLCRDGGRRRDSMRCTFWWELPLSLDNTGPPPGGKEDKGEDDLLLGCQSVWVNYCMVVL
jgi:hypothetical protein